MNLLNKFEEKIGSFHFSIKSTDEIVKEIIVKVSSNNKQLIQSED